MIFKLIVSAGVLLSSALSAQAQTTIDASKITCAQFVHHAVGNPRLLAAWLSGFYNGRRDSRVVDVQNFQGNLTKLEQFCYEEKNFKVPVMQAIEKLFNAGKTTTPR
jgi:HdeA/HdeB family